MKTTEGTTYRMLQTNLTRINSQLEELRVQGATGIKLNKASDDPSSIRPVLTTRTQLMHTDRYLETMGVTLDKMQATDGHMGHIENILQRVKEITVNSINGAMSEEDMVTFADEVNQMKQELLDSANAKVDGKYIFSGYAENTKPFERNSAYDPALYDETDSTTWAYLYMGTPNPTELEITPGEKLESNITGNDLFLGVSNTYWTDSTTPATGPPPSNLPPEQHRVDIFSLLERTEEALRTRMVDLEDANAFDAVGNTAAADALRNKLEGKVDTLELAANQGRRLRSQLGNRASRVDVAMFHQMDVKIDLQQVLSRYQDADAIETFNAIMQQETALQAALSITSKVSQISILDYF
ncbi:flagellar hook-associated protein FlgL [Desulfocapsa sp. AH-315-G09]|nr:flagellar hook-associated protein FlgL [Desulfocapsa sp.]MBN4065083.1 flagellar hook-associated protein FlgL [Desulfocapsa sp. AH-315-G09]